MSSEKNVQPKDITRLTVSVHVASIVNSEGYSNGKESQVHVYSSFSDFIEQSYSIYKDTWKECKECNVLDDSPLLTKKQYEKDMLKFGYVNIQCYDSHVCFEYFQREVTISREAPVVSVVNNPNENLMRAMVAYGLEYNWSDNEIIDALTDLGITQEDFIKAGAGDFVKNYFEDEPAPKPSLSDQIQSAAEKAGADQQAKDNPAKEITAQIQL